MVCSTAGASASATSVSTRGSRAPSGSTTCRARQGVGELAGARPCRHSARISSLHTDSRPSAVARPCGSAPCRVRTRPLLQYRSTHPPGWSAHPPPAPSQTAPAAQRRPCAAALLLRHAGKEVVQMVSGWGADCQRVGQSIARCRVLLSLHACRSAQTAPRPRPARTLPTTLASGCVQPKVKEQDQPPNSGYRGCRLTITDSSLRRVSAGRGRAGGMYESREAGWLRATLLQPCQQTLNKPQHMAANRTALLSTHQRTRCCRWHPGK